MDIKEIEFKSVDFWLNGKNGLIDLLINKVSKKEMKILNIGCGTADDLGVLLKYGDVTVIDKNPSFLDFVTNGDVKKHVGDARNLKFKDSSFDIVLMFDVLEHIKEDYLAIKEVHRVLKDGGYFIFILPAFNFLFSSHDKFLEHYRRYDMESVKEKTIDKFKIMDIGYWNFFLFTPVALARLLKKCSNKNAKTEIFPYVRKILEKILNVENILIRNNFHFPFGVSVYGILKNVK